MSNELKCPEAVATEDRTFHYLASALMPALNRPHEANRLFLDSLTRAAGSHMLTTYCGADIKQVGARGGLAPWQQKRATELLAAKLDGDLSMAEIAVECRLSARHFSRAFAQSFGTTPHRWQLNYRVDVAKALLLHGQKQIAEVAVATGFASQAHFARVFATFVGESPSDWRRRRGQTRH